MRVLIVGTGLIGASLGLALKALGGVTVTGWDADPTELATAFALGAMDEALPGREAVLAPNAADIYVLATPVLPILDWMQRLTLVLGPHQLVTDVGSTKREIAARAATLFHQPGRARFLPGHPMAGKEAGGAAHAEAGLFVNATWLFTPLDSGMSAPLRSGMSAPLRSGLSAPLRSGPSPSLASGSLPSPDAPLFTPVAAMDFTPLDAALFTPMDAGLFTPQDAPSPAQPEVSQAIAAAEEGTPAAEPSQLEQQWRALVSGIGAYVRDLDAEQHDEVCAWVSHLPQMLSTCLAALLEERFASDPEGMAAVQAIGGRALRETTRLGRSPYSMWRDIALTNTAPIAETLSALEQRLAHVRENLRTPELREEFTTANRFRAARAVSDPHRT